ncbi:MAG: hypothetical protein KF744_05690 [Taibaiella sp.]|nr:hypothetical protein [Taibaiella sp.]
MRQILFKTIVARFYVINTGFFLVSFILLFGLLNGRATIDLHHFIMHKICTSPGFFLGALVLWGLYALKCLGFMLRTVKSQSNTFLLTMQTLPDRKQKLLLAECYTAMLMPLLVYSAVTVVVGMMEGSVALLLSFAFLQLALVAVSILVFNTLNSTWKKSALNIPAILPAIRKPFVSYLLHFSLAERKGTFIGMKLLSLLLLQGMVMANKYTVDRESVSVLMMFLVSAHALLPLFYTGFMEGKAGFVRNLPVTRLRVLFTYLLTYAITFLPELLFLLINSKHAISLNQVLSLYSVALSQLLLYTALQYIPKMNTERYTMVVFAFFFASLLFLASFNLWPLVVTELTAAITVFYFFYYRYEAQKL